MFRQDGLRLTVLMDKVNKRVILEEPMVARCSNVKISPVDRKLLRR